MHLDKIIFAIVITLLLASSASAALKPGDVAPELSLQDRTGKAYSLRDVAAASQGVNRGLIVSFFATWCAPCRNELTLFNAMSDGLNRKGISIVLVDVKERFETIDDLLRELKVDKPLVLSDRYGKTAESYQVRFLPTTFFIGPDGMIKDIIFGEVHDKNDLMTSVNKLAR